MIPEAMARKYNAIPLVVYDHTLVVAIANPANIFALEALATQSQMRIEPRVASAEEIQEAIDFNYKAYDEIERQISNIQSNMKLDSFSGGRSSKTGYKMWVD